MFVAHHTTFHYHLLSSRVSVGSSRGGLLADICRMCDQRIKEYGFDFSLGHSSARNRDMGALFLILGKYGVHFQNQLKIIFKMVVKF